MSFRLPRPKTPRRGVTLVEMLVTVALLVLMMTVIVQIFQSATGAVSAAKTYQDLDSGLRQLDATIRQDLGNLTARLTPPLDPKNNLGYFEYIENSFADLQGEDTDDCLRFTVKAPEGQIFTGRFYPAAGNDGSNNLPADPTTWPQYNPNAPGGNPYEIFKNSNPITIQSQYAEIIYFLRNGNLYRRVLLVAPDRQVASNQTNIFVGGVFSAPAPAIQTKVSWIGLNDISTHTAPSNGPNLIIFNTLGQLTNRENRYAAPPFCNDFAQLTSISPPAWVAGGDGIPDDFNGDSVNDFVPSLYYNVPAGLINEAPPLVSGQTRGTYATFATVAFPYVYPYAYSKPDPSNAAGWIHSPDPTLSVTTVAGLNAINHSPLELGDNLPSPGGNQTWLGFPTWRETMSPNWQAPLFYPGQSSGAAQPFGLTPFDPSNGTIPAANSTQQLPPMTTALVGSTDFSGGSTGSKTPYRTSFQPFNDGAGSDSFAAYSATSGPASDSLWRQCWEDDLVLTGVRSFDVKAYDNSYPGYVDLGWGDDGRLVPFNLPGMTLTAATWSPSYLTGNPSASGSFPVAYVWPPTTTGSVYSLIGQTYAHEGRMPPLTADNRLNPMMENELSPFALGQFSNIGDNGTSTIRMRRTFDTWSTDYTNAPSVGVNPTTGLPYGLGINGGVPVYPSYPAPYPMPLRGLQIQIRVVDPRNERVKVLTIRQDFSDKL